MTLGHELKPQDFMNNSELWFDYYLESVILQLLIDFTFEQQLLPFNSIGMLRTLAIVSNQIVLSFGVFDSFFITKAIQD